MKVLKVVWELCSFFCFGRGGGGMGAIESLDNRQN